MAKVNRDPHYIALQWYYDHGADEGLSHHPVNRLKQPQQIIDALQDRAFFQSSQINKSQATSLNSFTKGLAEAKIEALVKVKDVTNIEALRHVIQNFDGLAIKKTATNLVFSDGNPKARIMVVGEAPGADEDRQGKPFVGVSGQLLDKILSCIGLSRTAEDLDNAVYISNVLNWRPPGNRTPSPAECELSQIFIEKHIALIQPKILILCGGIAAKTLLGRDESISKLRGQIQTFRPLCLIDKPLEIPAIVTYHPDYLLRTPSQKGKVWQDMLRLNAYLKALPNV